MGCASLVCFDRGASSRGGVTACRTRARAIEVKAPDARTIFAVAVKVGGDGRGWVNVVRALTTSHPRLGLAHRRWLGARRAYVMRALLTQRNHPRPAKTLTDSTVLTRKCEMWAGLESVSAHVSNIQKLSGNDELSLCDPEGHHCCAHGNSDTSLTLYARDIVPVQIRALGALGPALVIA